MPSVNEILMQMEQLSLTQLETFKEFIASRPYKEENRSPTNEELREVWDELQRLLAEAPEKDDDDDPISRLKRLAK